MSEMKEFLKPKPSSRIIFPQISKFSIPGPASARSIWHRLEMCATNATHGKPSVTHRQWTDKFVSLERLIEVRATISKGLGVFAKVDIPHGTRVISEAPLTLATTRFQTQKTLC